MADQRVLDLFRVEIPNFDGLVLRATGQTTIKQQNKTHDLVSMAFQFELLLTIADIPEFDGFVFRTTGHKLIT